jgi:hypothetical protein
MAGSPDLGAPLQENNFSLNQPLKNETPNLDRLQGEDSFGSFLFAQQNLFKNTRKPSPAGSNNNPQLLMEASHKNKEIPPLGKSSRRQKQSGPGDSRERRNHSRGILAKAEQNSKLNESYNSVSPAGGRIIQGLINGQLQKRDPKP